MPLSLARKFLCASQVSVSDSLVLQRLGHRPDDLERRTAHGQLRCE